MVWAWQAIKQAGSEGKMFIVTKKFTSGILNGMTVSEKTSVKFTVGQKIKACVGSSTYEIVSVVEA